MWKSSHPAIPLLRIHLTDILTHAQNDTYARLFIAALFVRAKMKTTKKGG